MNKLLIFLVLSLGVGVLFACADDSSKNTPVDKVKAEVVVPAVNVPGSSGATVTEEETASEEDADVSGYKPKVSTAATADVSKFRTTDSSVEDSSSE